MAISRHPIAPGRRAALLPAALLPMVLVAGALPGVASTAAAWEELRLRAVQTCSADLRSRNVRVLAVETFDASGARWQPTDEGLRVRLRVQPPGQAARSVTCHYRRPLFSPAL
jgi:hypothetical protein